MAARTYVIQWQSNPSYCIGIQQAAAGMPAVLTLLQGSGNRFTQWQLDANTGTITSAADPGLYLDVEGVSPGNGTKVIVSMFVLGRPYQSWNWLGSPARIMNNGALNFYVDNTRCSTEPGNPIILYDATGHCQGWAILPVAALEHAAGRDREAAGVGDD